ncbi:MAG TPA: M56 family metallopeptidase [Thermoanaerobaculia bacterium]|jgi:beta-lactamase regulating signal transducer with metallopeptidase domain/Flp pilus assembly protein TadD
MNTLFEIAARLQSAGSAEALLLIAVKATLILLIAHLLLAVLSRSSAATRHVVATLALVSVLALAFFTPVVPTWNLAWLDAPENTIGALGDEEPSSIGTALSLARETGIVPAKPLSIAERAVNVTRNGWKGMIVLGIGFISLLLLAQMLAGMVGVALVARNAEPFGSETAERELEAARAHLGLTRPIRLLRSERVSVPVIWGIAAPVLMLPADSITWSRERLRVVLLHELAHLRRLDGVTLLITRAAVSLFWFHPLAWSMNRAARNACERACDDLVLASGAKPSDYADHLLHIAKALPSFDPFRSVTLAMSRKSELEGRLLSILQAGISRSGFTKRGVAIACAIAAFIVIPISAVRLIADGDAPPPPPEKLIAKASGSSIDVVDDFDDVMPDFGKFFREGKVPKTGEDWNDRGNDLYKDQKYAEAAEAYRRAVELKFRPEITAYNMACAYALADKKDQALGALATAVRAGYDDFDHIKEDSDLDSLRSDPRFAQIAGSASTERLRAVLADYTKAKTGDEWFDAGLELLRLRRFDESVNAFQQAIAANEKPVTSMYNIACAYSLKGDANNGMAWLSRAVASGFPSTAKLDEDADLELLRRQPQFAGLRRLAQDLELKDGGWLFFEDWSEATKHHREMAAKHPDSGRAWFNLGYASLQAHDYGNAVMAFEKAFARDYRRGPAAYNMACAHARAGQNDAAIAALIRARDHGFELKNYLAHDSDLRKLRKDPRFQELKRQTLRKSS